MKILVKGIKFVQNFNSGTESIIDCEECEVLENIEESIEEKHFIREGFWPIKK